MRGTKRVVLAFFAPRKTGDATFLPELRHARAAAGQYLVAVGLMADIPHQAIIRRVEHIVQRDREFDRPQIRRKMSARGGHRINDKFA